MAEEKLLENAIQRELQYKQKIANLFPDNDDIDVLPLEVAKSASLNWIDDMIDADRRVMAEEKLLENAIQRELQYKQKIANLFPDNDDIDVLPLEVAKSASLNWIDDMIDADRRVMAEEKLLENAIQRELQYKQKIANLFPDNDDIDVLPLEVKRWKDLVPKRNRSTDGRTDSSQTTITCKYTKFSQGTFESDEEINTRGNISRSNSNAKRQKALISKNTKFAGRIIDCNATTCIHTDVSQETFKPLESDGQIPSMTRPPRPSLSPTHTYSSRKKNAESGNSGFVSPQQQHTKNIMHYCKDCEVFCSGDLCYELHLRGNKHKVKLQCRGDSSVNGKNKQVIRCDLCEIYCQDETSLKMHLKGQKHKAKQHEIEYGGKIKHENRHLFWCELCQVPCMNEDNFTLHRKGKKHQRQLYVLKEKKKADA